MRLIKDKRCQKCGSKNVYLENDQGTWYECCLICGLAVPLKKIEPAKKDEASWPDDISIEA